MATKPTAVTKPSTSLMPKMDIGKLDTALAELKQESELLPKLKARAEVLKVVSTPEQFSEAGALLLEVRAFKKVPGFKLNPFMDIAKRVTEFLRTEKTKHENAAEMLDGIISGNMSDYTRREKESAQREQDLINQEKQRLADIEAEAERKATEDKAADERKARQKEIDDARKAGDLSKREADRMKKEAEEREKREREQAARDEQAAKLNVPETIVQPNTPTVAGLRKRVLWKFAVANANQLPRIYLMQNDVAIGQMVREVKSKEEAEARCPGITVWSEDVI